MNTPLTPGSTAPPTPLPTRQFRGFMLFWHIFLLGGFAVTLWIAAQKSPAPSAGRLALLAALVTVQAALYLLTFGQSHRRTVTGWWWLAYFAASLGLWAVEVTIEPCFEWLVGPYVGQMLGALSPRYSVPASLSILFGYLSWRVGWEQLSHLSGWMLVGGGAMVASWMGLALFLHKLTVTSTERARLIEELEAARRELELARDRESELAVLRERERLARDLHDSLGHALVTLSIHLEALQRLYPTDPARAEALLGEMKGLTRASMEDLRRSLANLRAPGLGDRPLVATLRALADEVAARTGLAISVHLDAGADHLRPRLAEVLYRAGHEALANVEKHARAKQIHLRLELTPAWIELRVEDDGIGLPEHPESKPGHYGLRGLRERVEGLGGTLALGKGDAGGTCLQARVPVVAGAG